MSTYIPETWVVRSRYANGLTDLGVATFDEAADEFDRWASRRDATVEERTLRRIVADAGTAETVPVRLIRARADRLDAASRIYRGES